jgi:hypothetical protein
MTPDRAHRTTLSDRLLLGAVLGAPLAILAVAFGVPGLVTLLAVVALSAFIAPRFAFLAGLLLAVGALWLFFTTQDALRCATNPTSCSGPEPAPFVVVSAVVFGAGVRTLIGTRRRLLAQPPRDR